MEATEGEVRPATIEPRPTPTTQAGRDVLAHLGGYDGHLSDCKAMRGLTLMPCDCPDRILAIEAEAGDQMAQGWHHTFPWRQHPGDPHTFDARCVVCGLRAISDHVIADVDERCLFDLVRREAEARDATGLRDVVIENRRDWVKIVAPHQINEDGDFSDWTIWTDETAASGSTLEEAYNRLHNLAAAPQEPCWPSAEDEAAVEALADARTAVSGELNPTPTDRRWWVEDSRHLLVRLHEAEQS